MLSMRVPLRNARAFQSVSQTAGYAGFWGGPQKLFQELYLFSPFTEIDWSCRLCIVVIVIINNSKCMYYFEKFQVFLGFFVCDSETFFFNFFLLTLLLLFHFIMNEFFKLFPPLFRINERI